MLFHGELTVLVYLVCNVSLGHCPICTVEGIQRKEAFHLRSGKNCEVHPLMKDSD